MLTAAVIDEHRWVEHTDGVAACKEVKGNGIRIAAGGFQANTYLASRQTKGAQPGIQSHKAFCRIGKDLVESTLPQTQHDIQFGFGDINADESGDHSDQRHQSHLLERVGMIEYIG